MNHSHVLVKEKEYLLKHLSFIDENYIELNNLYLSSTPIKERVRDFLSLYVSEVEHFIGVRNSLGQDIPFQKVFIGTKVTIAFEGESDSEEYHICFPEMSDPDRGFVSFLSPVGRQLLLKNKGESISLNVPNGTITVKIEDVTISDSLSI